MQVGAGPDAIALDPTNHDIYVANGGSGTVSVISDTNNNVVTTIAVGQDPMQSHTIP